MRQAGIDREIRARHSKRGVTDKVQLSRRYFARAGRESRHRRESANGRCRIRERRYIPVGSSSRAGGATAKDHGSIYHPRRRARSGRADCMATRGTGHAVMDVGPRSQRSTARRGSRGACGEPRSRGPRWPNYSGAGLLQRGSCSIPPADISCCGSPEKPPRSGCRWRVRDHRSAQQREYQLRGVAGQLRVAVDVVDDLRLVLLPLDLEAEALLLRA